MFAVVTVFLLASAGQADMIPWNPTRRPPLSLSAALERAEKELADKKVAVKYCSSLGSVCAIGYGLRQVAWNLYFVTDVDREVCVYVNSEDHVESQDWGEPDRPAVTENRRNLDEIKRRVSKIAAAHPGKVTIEHSGDSLTVYAGTRTYMVHRPLDDGEYSDAPQPVLGPDLNGFWLRICDTRDVDWASSYRWSDSGAAERYWSSRRETIYLTELGKHMAVEWRFDRWSKIPWWPSWGADGRLADNDVERIVLQIRRVLGRRNEWDPAVVPPIPLKEAVRRAEAALGEEADNRYCMRFELEGDQRGDRRYGKWHFFFPATDGSQKHVVVRMDGKIDVEDWDPIDYESWYETQELGRVAVSDDLDVARNRLEGLLAEASIEAAFDVRGDTLHVTHNLRKFKVHPWNEIEWSTDITTSPPPPRQGAFATNLVERIGPRRDGFSLQVRYGKRVGRQWGISRDMLEYYWETRRGGFPKSLPPPDGVGSPEPPPVLGFVLRCGSGVDHRLRHQIVMALVK